MGRVTKATPTKGTKVITLIQDEYLHDPSIIPSNYLNVTVSVQDKDTDNQTSVRRIVGDRKSTRLNSSHS